MITIKGKIEFKQIGMGVWVLIGENDTTYELYEPPTDIQAQGLAVEITGNIRNDIMTMAMVGPVLEIKSFNVI